MSYKKDLSYRNIPFSSETPQEDFFLYGTITSLHIKCQSNKHKVIKVRTVGILRNEYGCFYIKEMIAAHNSSSPDSLPSIEVSMAYMSKTIRSSVMPYPVQLFGALQWVNHPVIFAQIMQPLSVPVATLLHKTMSRVCTLKDFNGSVDDGNKLDQ